MKVRNFQYLTIALFISAFLLPACGGRGSTAQPSTTVQGSAGDGPITGGTVSVIDANGAAVATTPANPTTGADAQFSFTVPSVTALPLTITVTGGTDTVTGAAQDFPLKTAVTTLPLGGTVTGNANPISTLAVESALARGGGTLTAANLTTATANVLGAVGFGLAVGTDPLYTPVTNANIANIVRANEAAAEMIRRASNASGNTLADTIAAIGQDLTDGIVDGKAAPGADNAQVSDTTAAQILTQQAQVSAELLANNLTVTTPAGATITTASGANFTAKLNSSITLTGNIGDVTADVPTREFLDQTREAINIANTLTGGGNAALNDLIGGINTLTAGTIPSSEQQTELENLLTTADASFNTATTGATNPITAGNATTTIATIVADTTAPSAPAITAPTTGTTINSTITVSGTAEANALVTVLDGSAFVGTATANGTGAWTLTAPTLAEGAHTLTAVATDSAGNTSSASTATTVTVDTSAPNTTASPAGGTYNSTQSVTLTVNETATIYYTIDGSTPTTGSSTYSSAISISATTTLKFFAVDTAGNSETVKTETYTIDTTAPTVTFKSPANGATGVALNTTVSATFSEAMGTSTITTSTFTVDNGVTGTIAFSGGDTIATFTPTTNLANDTTYTVSLIAGIKDLAANSITATGWSFTTALAAPTGVAVTAGNAQNTISWNVVSTATSYNLYYGTTSGVTTANGTKITDITSPYILTGLTNGTTYYYVVTAVNAGGESAVSSEVSGIPVRKVPDTGQTVSYTATFGEDSDYAINPPSYTDNGDDTVTDNVTGLMWEKCSEGQIAADCSGGAAVTYNWYEATGTANAASNPGGATNVCGNLSLAGHADWRLPDLKELKSIVNYETRNPSINSTYFPKTVASYYWSFTAGIYGTSNAWRVRFYYGSVSYRSEVSTSNVRCVRGGQAGPIFTDNGDGTVTDNVTTLMWQQQDNGTTRTWEQAIDSCETLSLASYTDWRLPNVNEIQSIVDYSTFSPAINATYFPGTHPSNYWSSTTLAFSTPNAWSAYLYNGNINYSNKSFERYYARCVRGGQ